MLLLSTSRRPWYWFCQGLAWFSFLASQYFALIMLRLLPPGANHVGWYLLAKAAVGLLFSHTYRYLLLRYRVPDLPLARQVPVVLLGIVGIALGPVLIDLVEEGGGAAYTWSKYGFSLMASARYSTIWVLSYHFFAAGQRLARAEMSALRAEAARRQVELDLLRSQINPHFLFNALNSVRALTLSDPHRARTAVTQLADLLRYTLNYEQRQLIPLGEELAAVRDYLALEQTRFGPERLRLDLAVPEDLLAWPVPPAALLTLVENAVKHGIGATPGGGVLRLLGWPEAAPAGPGRADEGARLHLEVSQPGCLPAPGTARPTPAPVHAGGLGLANTRQRLRALYGGAASLTLHEHPHGTVVAHLGLPYSVISH